MGYVRPLGLFKIASYLNVFSVTLLLMCTCGKFVSEIFHHSPNQVSLYYVASDWHLPNFPATTRLLCIVYISVYVVSVGI